MGIRFSLRTVLILLTITSFFVFRYSQRRHLQVARLAIEETGGEVFYRWERPCVVNQSVIIAASCGWGVEGPYTTNECERRTRKSPGFSVTGFLLGSHDDVSIAAVSLPAASVNGDTTAILHRLNSLEIVVLCVDEVYYTIESKTNLPPELHRKILQSEFILGIEQDLTRATTILESNFPDVKLFRRGVVLDAE